MEVSELVVVATGTFGNGRFHLFEECDSGGEFFTVAHDADMAPHQVADLCESGGNGGCG